MSKSQYGAYDCGSTLQEGQLVHCSSYLLVLLYHRYCCLAVYDYVILRVLQLLLVQQQSVAAASAAAVSISRRYHIIYKDPVRENDSIMLVYKYMSVTTGI